MPRPPASRSANAFPHGIEDRVIVADRLADGKGFRLFQRLPDFLAAGDFAQAGAAGIVFEDDDIAREERPVRAAQIEQHAVVSGDGHDEHFGNDGVRRIGDLAYMASQV